MTSQEFHNNRVELYSVLRKAQRDSEYEKADSISRAIENLENEFYKYEKE